MLIGSYILEERVGRGAMAEVWAARSSASDEPVAVKIITGHPRHVDQTRDTFFREVRTVASLNHRGIVRIYDYGRGEFAPAGGVVPYLVTELATGGTLGSGWQPGNFPDVQRVIVSILDALAHAHARGVIHRDLKPGNVLRTSAKPLADVKVADFGIARLVPLGERTGGDEVIAGTPPYMAPEQIRGDWRDQGPWTDLYSVGCIAWKMVTGNAPFEGERDDVLAMHLEADLPKFQPRVAVPPGFEPWLLRLLRRKIPDRTQRAADAVMELLALEPVTDPATVELPAHFDPAIASTLLIETEESTTEAFHVDTPRTDELVTRLRRIASPQRAIIDAAAHTELRLWGLRRLPFVGREAERTELWSILQRAFEAPAPQLVLLHGAPGTGKSSLARWLVERSHELGLSEPLMIVHDPIARLDDGLPGALVRWFRLEGLSPAEAVTRLRARLRRHLDDETEAVATAGALTDWIVSRTNISPAGFEGRERAAGLLTVLRMLTKNRLGVLWIEDGHRAARTLDYLRGALELAGDAPPPLLILVADQSADAAEDSEFRRAIGKLTEVTQEHTVILAPLDEQATRTLLQTVLPLRPDFAAALASRTSGNPLFAIQMLGDWIARNELSLDDQGHFVVRDLETELPRGLRGILDRKLVGVARQLDQRPDELRHSLELAAAFGNRVRRVEWAIARDKAALPDRGGVTDLLIRSGIAVPAGEDWAFAHDLFREALVDEARASGRWQRWNELCARTLEDVYAEPDPVRSASHYFEAQRWEEAIEPCLRASRHHFDSLALDAAQHWVDRASEALDRAQAPPSDPRRGKILVALSKFSQARGDYDRTDALLDQLELTARQHGWSDLLVSAIGRRSPLRLRQGDPQGSLDTALRAEGAATVHGDEFWRFVSLGHAVNAAIALGRWDDAERWARDRLRIADDLGDDVSTYIVRASRAHARFRLGSIRSQRGDLDEAASLLGEVDQFAPEDDKILRALTLALRGDIARFRDDSQSARSAYEKSLELFRTWSYRGDEAVLVRLAILDLQAGEIGAARARVDAARTSIADRGTDSERALVTLAAATLDAAEGDWSAVDQCLAREVVHTREGLFLYDWLATRAAEAERTEIVRRVRAIATRVRTALRKNP